MISLENPSILVQPKWLELPNIYYSPTVSAIPTKDLDIDLGGFIVIYPSKEEAIQSMMDSEDSSWFWDGEDPEEILVSQALAEAKEFGFEGVKVDSYINGEWKTLATYYAKDPYKGDK